MDKTSGPDEHVTPVGPSDYEAIQDPSATLTVPVTRVHQMFNYPSGSVMDMAYGANDPNQMASNLLVSGQLYRMARGFPYKRVGRMVPTFPQFNTQSINVHNIASQPQANSSAQQITQPTADKSTTVTVNGTPYITRPTFTKISITG